MIQELRGLVGGYYDWVRDKSALREIDGSVVEITTPYLDRSNDYLQIYASRDGDFVRLSDAGETIAGLRFVGCELDTPHRERLLKSVLQGFGVQRHGDEIFVQTTAADFAPKKHNLVQALLTVNDMFVLAQPFVANLFHEDVAHWLHAHDVRALAGPKFTGKSGLDHYFDFAIPPSSSAPERLVRAIAKPDRNTAKLVAFAWMDTRDVRTPGSRLYAILNDESKPASSSVVTALSEYQITSVPWSERDRFLEALAR